MTDEEELKARIEQAKRDLAYYSLHSDLILESGWETKEELEQAINDILDDLIGAQNKLNNLG